MSDIQRPSWLQNVHFVLSAAKPSQFPDDGGVEVAFVGRSNVGKSSVLNTLTARKQLAKTSKTPGRTQLINFFHCTDQIRLVDLPGYGFAKVSKSQRAQWDELISAYLEQRKSLSGIVLIMDIRHPLKESDIQIIEWIVQARVPLLIVLNKSDKLSRQAAQQTYQQVRRELNGYADGIQCVLLSALKKTNLSAVYDVLQEWCEA